MEERRRNRQQLERQGKKRRRRAKAMGKKAETGKQEVYSEVHREEERIPWQQRSSAMEKN